MTDLPLLRKRIRQLIARVRRATREAHYQDVLPYLDRIERDVESAYALGNGVWMQSLEEQVGRIQQQMHCFIRGHEVPWPVYKVRPEGGRRDTHVR
ncbi:molecular chaperone GrpE (heat shock protein) [Deinobacterium chartae]|uniref:Molecular chaperone GrpE (Heat shock protein) n=1 Tax=Deinobacterium chartae TaxID=521158 RepID=A0A841HZX0_9DEIO|nr:hypothetical protein [Deinobacterium chartae]MBB6097750.1 molecular chaperone GrpE (heat shock protein) [Deinobacterium chartae]